MRQKSWHINIDNIPRIYTQTSFKHILFYLFYTCNSFANIGIKTKMTGLCVEMTEVSHIIVPSAQALNQHQYLHLLVNAC